MFTLSEQLSKLLLKSFAVVLNPFLAVLVNDDGAPKLALVAPVVLASVHFLILLSLG